MADEDTVPIVDGWKVSMAVDYSELFTRSNYFNDDVSDWDISDVSVMVALSLNLERDGGVVIISYLNLLVELDVGNTCVPESIWTYDKNIVYGHKLAKQLKLERIRLEELLTERKFTLTDLFVSGGQAFFKLTPSVKST